MSSARVFAILTPTVQGSLSQSEQGLSSSLLKTHKVCEESVGRLQNHHRPDFYPNGTTKYNNFRTWELCDHNF